MSPTRFRLQELIDRVGTTQAALSRKTGVSAATINRLCGNVTAQVSLETLDRLAAALGVEPGEILVRQSEARPKRKGK